MDQKENKEKVAQIKDSLKELLGCNYVSMGEYRRLIAHRKLADPRRTMDDRTFQQQYPTHPMASENRFRRIKLADSVRDIAREVHEVVPEEILDLLHTVLFDCCASVRHSLSHALFYGGSRRSAYYLGKLIEDEGESAMVRRYARIARERCLMREDPISPEKRIALLISNNIDLATAILGVVEQEGATFVMAEPPYTELIAWSSEIQIVDRWLMGKDNWDTFCDYLDEVNETETIYPVRDEDGDIIAEEPIFDHSPLIIVDNHMEKALKTFRKPNKPNDKLFYIESGPVDVVAKLAQYILQGKHIGFKELNEEINRERGGY